MATSSSTSPAARMAPSLGMDLTTDGTTVLYTNHGPDVLTYDLDRERAGPAFASIPGANCTDVVALYNGDAIVGCADADETTFRYCAYLLDEQQSGQVSKRWCAPDAEDFTKRACAPQTLAAVSLGMDVDREHFYFSFVSTDLSAAFPTLYKIRLSDFKQVANASSALDIISMSVSHSKLEPYQPTR